MAIMAPGVEEADEDGTPCELDYVLTLLTRSHSLAWIERLNILLNILDRKSVV